MLSHKDMNYLIMNSIMFLHMILIILNQGAAVMDNPLIGIITNNKNLKNNSNININKL